VDNGKTSRPSVCNALETLLVARPAASAFLPLIKQKLDESQVELRGCPETAAILGSAVRPAVEADFETEFSDYILAVKVVSGLEEALEHISKYSSGHSEVIVTNNYFTAQTFVDRVDAAAVYVNASTRFTDGEEFGLGAEIGISTQKMHARGPMGLLALTSIKYVVYGTGQVR
jgi:glutamate-5-semialdehyde dehydrogenase